MKTRTFIIHSENEIKRLSTFLEAQPKEPLIQVVVSEHKKDRTVEQNRLYHLWLTIIADELGETKEDAHYDLRRRILLPIYERDDLGYADMLNAVRKVHKLGGKAEAKIQADFIIKHTSTTAANIKQFTEYLKEIERDMVGKGIILPRPEDRYYQAMGIKQK